MKLLMKVHTNKTRKRMREVYQPISKNYNTSNNDNKDAHHTTASCIVKNINTWILLSILVTISIGIIVALYFLFTTDFGKINGGEKRAPREILFGNEYEDDTIPNLGNGHLVIDRKQWGATLGTHNSTPIILHHPISYVIITHIGVQSNPCDTVYNCSIKMRTIQDSAIAEKGLTDLPANFYVSHDGYVYVGRGWNQVNTYTNHSLAICFMGDYIRHIPSDKQFDGVQYLLAYGVARQFIAPDYKLVAHNQTKSTKSPGSHVYRNIIKWPHWYACGIGSNPKCESELN